MNVIFKDLEENCFIGNIKLCNKSDVKLCQSFKCIALAFLQDNLSNILFPKFSCNKLEIVIDVKYYQTNDAI